MNKKKHSETFAMNSSQSTTVANSLAIDIWYSGHSTFLVCSSTQDFKVENQSQSSFFNNIIYISGQGRLKKIFQSVFQSEEENRSLTRDIFTTASAVSYFL